MRVALFVPCYVDQLAPSVAEATVAVLERAGCAVHYDPDQTCCGQPFANLGLAHEAARLARAHLERFAGHDAIVAPSASCVATVRRHYEALGAGCDPAGRRVRERTFELSEFLVRELGVTDVGARFPHKVALLASCHGLRELGLGRPSEAVRLPGEPEMDLGAHSRQEARFPRSEPETSGERGRSRSSRPPSQVARSEPEMNLGADPKREARFPRSEPEASGEIHKAGPTELLLRAVADLELVNPSRDECCGFGGAFAAELPEVSARMGRAKLADLAATGAEFATGTDASCLLHLDGIRRKHGAGPRMIHLAEILAAR